MFLKKKLNAGKSVMGTMLSLVYNPDVARVFAEAGLDYFIVDCEHGAYTFREINSLVSVSKNAGTAVLVRIPQVDRAYVQVLLDIGVEGFMIPGVKSAETMRETVRLAKYPPMGERGIGGGIVTDFQNVNLPEWIEERNGEVFIMAQIEHRKAVEDIDAILGVTGVDAVVFGPRDLSVDLGVTGQVNHPKIFECYEKVYESADRLGVTKGFFTGGDASELKWGIERGARVLLWAGDATALMGFISAGVKTARSFPGYKT